MIILFCLAFASFPAAAEEPFSGLNLQEFENRAEGKVSWTGNPFVQPANDVAVSELVISGIVYREGNSAAIINDQIVRTGEKIGWNEVIGIEETSVVLRNENGLFRLTLKGGS